MDKMPTGETLTLLLDDGEPLYSVSNSVTAEGQTILQSDRQNDGHYLLLIRKDS